MALERGDSPSLREGIEWHLRAMRARRAAPRSLATLVEEQQRHLGDWLERPLASLSRHEVATRHEDLTLASGPWLANRVMQQLRAVYNTAARRCETLSPTNPTLAVTFNRLRRRREPIPWGELPAWRERVEALRNPVRRDLQWMLLLTGLRSLDARSLRWEHVDLSRGTLHRPSPKGGPERAFTIPICRALRERLLRIRELSRDDDGWVFPARDRAGRTTFVQCPKEQRRVDGRRVRHLPGPHRLRDTFATAAHEARVHPFDLKLLLNHALPAEDDVTQGYTRPSLEHLAGACEAVAGFLLERAGREGSHEAKGPRRPLPARELGQPRSTSRHLWLHAEEP
ncbi:MAG TPA: tyrosine-type recombinase/integrase [Planctomycetota bacterium]|nr:tyrosine-type recombinase/integrase [Planctomycetota bacterium]